MGVFDKLNEHFEGTFAAAGLEAPDALQEKVLKKARQGGDLLLIAPQDQRTGMAAALAALEKVPESCEGSPRVLIICSDPGKAKDLAGFLARVSRRKELMVEPAHDKGVMIEQRNHIYEGADIVVGNPKRIFDLYIQNGLNLSLLKLFVIFEADAMLKEATIGQLRRIADSLPRCQRMVFAEALTARLEKVTDDLLSNPEIFETE